MSRRRLIEFLMSRRMKTNIDVNFMLACLEASLLPDNTESL